MYFTIIGYDTHEMVEIYDVIEAPSPDEAQNVCRKVWPSSHHEIIAIFHGEPENIYNPDIDSVNYEGDYEGDYDDDDDDDDDDSV